MDRPLPDNAALQDEAFHRLVAAAIQDGIQEYFDGPAAVVPIAPSNLQASTGPAAVTLTWTDVHERNRLPRRAEILEHRPVGPARHGQRQLGSGAGHVFRPGRRRGQHLRVSRGRGDAAGASRQFSNEATATVAPHQSRRPVRRAAAGWPTCRCARRCPPGGA